MLYLNIFFLCSGHLPTVQYDVPVLHDSAVRFSSSAEGWPPESQEGRHHLPLNPSPIPITLPYTIRNSLLQKGTLVISLNSMIKKCTPILKNSVSRFSAQSSWIIWAVLSSKRNTLLAIAGCFLFFWLKISEFFIWKKHPNIIRGVYPRGGFRGKGAGGGRPPPSGIRRPSDPKGPPFGTF